MINAWAGHDLTVSMVKYERRKLSVLILCKLLSWFIQLIFLIKIKIKFNIAWINMWITKAIKIPKVGRQKDHDIQ